MTLKHHRGGGGLLHSHPSLYPEDMAEIQQQQVELIIPLLLYTTFIHPSLPPSLYISLSPSLSPSFPPSLPFSLSLSLPLFLCPSLTLYMYLSLPLMQITAYSHKDENNKWLVKKAKETRDNGTDDGK